MFILSFLNMRILFFGNYDSEYSRNRVLIKGLKANGVEILECRVSPSTPFWPILLIFRYFSFIIHHSSFDILFVPFSGQQSMFLARLVALRFGSGQARKQIIFDAFTSHYGGYILDRKRASPSSPLAWWYRFLDRWSCKLADAVLLDTRAHIGFFVKEFGLPEEKFHRIFVGADTDVFYPRPPRKADGMFAVHFHGHYIPLQGVRYILKAAKLLEPEGVIFHLIGRGQTYLEDKQLAGELQLTNVYFRDNVPYEQLPDYMTRADVCLGIFGDTPKTPLVIPNKVFEAIAMAKPVITADTPAVRELLDQQSALFVPAADPQALADAILSLKNDAELRRQLAQAGYDILNAQATPEILGKQVLDLAKTLI